MKHLKQFLLMAMLLFTLAPLQVSAKENIDVKEILWGHIKDSYEWHITKVGDRVIKTRLTEEEYAEFSERVSLCKMSQAEFIRQALTKSRICPVITVSPVNDELLSAVGKLTAEYGKIGGNLNQIARCLNEYGAPYNTLSNEVRAAIAELAALKFEVLQKVGEAVGNVQTYQL